MGFKSIRARLTAWYVFLLGIVLVLFSVFLNYFLTNRLHESIDNSLKVSASVVAKTAVMNQSRLPMPGFGSFFDQFLGQGNLNKFYRIYDGSGNVGSRSRNIDASQFPLTQEAYSVALKGMDTYETFDVGGKQQIRVLTMPVLGSGKLINLVQVGTSLGAVRETLKNLRIFLIAAVPSVLALAALVGRIMVGRALKPLSKIAETAQDVGSGVDFTKRIPVSGSKDELGQLAATFNDMMDRLEKSYVQMRQFSSDASHELRTPLTVLRGQNELVLTKDREPGEYQEVISSNLEEIDYMSKVLEDLFILSKSDENEVWLDRKPLDLKMVVEEVCRHAEVLAEEKNMKIVIAFLESVTINGDVVKLRQMMWNILQNAIKYTPPGGEIKISLQNQDNDACLTIQDTGIGISREHLFSIFDRFFRVDKSRSRKEGGSGLGLSICKFIAEAHNGKIEVESDVGLGTKFKIRIPKIQSLKV